MSAEGSLKTVWKTQGPEGTVNGAIAKALQAAAEYYGLARSPAGAAGAWACFLSKSAMASKLTGLLK